MKVYIAAPWPIRDEAIQAMLILERQGHFVTSRWLKVEEDDTDPYVLEKAAYEDLANIREADALLLLHPEDWHNKGTGGRHVEFGYALALAKQIIIVGRKTNAFHHLAGVQVVERVEDL